MSIYDVTYEIMKKTLLTIGLLSLAVMLTGCASQNSMSSHTPAIDSEEAFIVNMIPHHQEAIESADMVRGKSMNVEVRKLAEGIVNAQEKEVTDMQDRLANWYATGTLKANYMDMMPSISDLSSPDLDRAFLEGMIDHHKWAIAMAKDVLKVKPREEIVTLARNIIKTQNEEISTMKKLLKDLK